MGSERFKERFGKNHLNKGKKLFDRYGIWAVIVGAFSPIPYSSICWTAGIYNMKFKPFIITSLLTRIPRFFLMGFIGYII
jgi:membrane protein YqaA with SNARE-associated domain